MAIKSADITREFVMMSPDKIATSVPVTPTIYADIDRDFNQFLGHELISAYDFDNDWPSWETLPGMKS